MEEQGRVAPRIIVSSGFAFDNPAHMHGHSRGRDFFLLTVLSNSALSIT